MEKPSEIKALFQRYLDNRYSEDDLQQIIYYFQSGTDQGILRSLVEDELSRPEEEADSEAIDRITSRVDQRLFGIWDNRAKTVPLYKRWYFSAAAAILLLSAAAGAFYLYQSNPDEIHASQNLQNDAVPGGNKAMLTLSDGSIISLDEAASGALAKQSGITITKTMDGQLVYQHKGSISENEAVGFNTVTTPKGGQYRIILPDGTQVWLNAASSLHYPTRFTGNDRRVTLTGEGYFEVAKDKSKLFIVQSDRQQVQVLGTHFNINAYENEAVTNTTLLEGSVRITSKMNEAQSTILAPGQQAIVNQELKVKSVDVAQAVAWKEGLFLFHNTDMKTLMRQLERWYDIEVEEASLPDKKFNGEMSRDVKLSQVLKMIEITSGLKFKLEERRLILIK